FDQFELGGISVLVFVNKHVTEFIAAGLQRFGMFAKQPQSEEDEIVKIHGVASPQRGFIAQANVLGERAHAGIGKSGASLILISKPAEQAQYRRRISLFSFG